jgi:hypothetical protein
VARNFFFSRIPDRFWRPARLLFNEQQAIFLRYVWGLKLTTASSYIAEVKKEWSYTSITA